MTYEEKLKKIQNTKITPKYLDTQRGQRALREGSDLAFGIDDDKS